MRGVMRLIGGGGGDEGGDDGRGDQDDLEDGNADVQDSEEVAHAQAFLQGVGGRGNVGRRGLSERQGTRGGRHGPGDSGNAAGGGGEVAGAIAGTRKEGSRQVSAHVEHSNR